MSRWSESATTGAGYATDGLRPASKSVWCCCDEWSAHDCWSGHATETIFVTVTDAVMQPSQCRAAWELELCMDKILEDRRLECEGKKVVAFFRGASWRYGEIWEVGNCKHINGLYFFSAELHWVCIYYGETHGPHPGVGGVVGIWRWKYFLVPRCSTRNITSQT